MKQSLSVVGTLLLAATSVAYAQEGPPPPKVIQVAREQVKVGKGLAHERIELGWPKAMAKAGDPAHYIAMTSVSGPPEAWFLTGWPSFAAIEKDQEATDKNPAYKAELDQLSAQDGEVLSGYSSWLMAYREGASYRAAVDVGKMRYISVTTYRVNPGRDREFAAWRNAIKEFHEKAKQDEHWALYQLVSGGFGGTYVLLTPAKSMAEMDADIHGKAYQDAVGEEGRARLRELQKEAVFSSTTQLFAFSPKMSYPSKELAASDPDFWTPKPAAPAAPPKK